MELSKLAAAVLILALAVTGCGDKPAAPTADTSKPTAKKVGEHGDDGDHGAGPHGGVITEFGKAHAEFVVDHAKKLATVYILDEKLARPEPIAAAKLTLSIKSPAFQADLLAVPQPGDPAGTSSRFVAAHDHFGMEQTFAGTVSGEVNGKPYFGDFQEKPHAGHAADPKEADVYLKPAGLYTEADIAANGRTTVSARYKGLKVSHDIKPKAGDQLCPVTLTKANAELKWVIGGKEYTFCCHPCVEEFVTLAKTAPAEVKPPEAYVKK